MAAPGPSTARRIPRGISTGEKASSSSSGRGAVAAPQRRRPHRACSIATKSRAEGMIASGSLRAVSFSGPWRAPPPRYAGAWAVPGEVTSRATRRRACSTGSSGITWMTSWAPPPTGPTGPGRHLRGQDLEGHQASRSSNRAADEIRAGPELKDRAGNRRDDHAVASDPRRSCHRISGRPTFRFNGPGLAMLAPGR